VTATVLVIDSNATIRTIAALALQSTGVTVRTLASPEQALETAKSTQPDILICAADMPAVNANFIKQLKNAAKKNPSVVLLVSSADETTPPWANATLAKPFKSEQLKLLVRQVLERKTSELPLSEEAIVRLSDPLIAAGVARLILRRGRPAAPLALGNPLASVPYLLVSELKDEADLQQLPPLERLIVVASPALDLAKLPSRVIAVRTPLSEKSVEDALNKFFPELAPQDDPMSTREQAALAAKIAAAVLDKLLVDGVLARRNWREAASCAGREALRICQGFAKEK
jgi:CheY-like chemotaxis protein